MSTAEAAISPHVSYLPDEVLIHIFQYVPWISLPDCELVCQRWRRLVRDPLLWKRIHLVCVDWGSQELYKQTISLLASHGEHIRNLTLDQSYEYNDIRTSLLQCVNLTSLDMSQNTVPFEFNHDITNFPNLINLKLPRLLNNCAMNIQFENFKNLNTISIQESYIAPLSRDSLLLCDNLNHFYFNWTDGITLEFLKKLATLKSTSLVTLHIIGYFELDDNFMHLLEQCLHLKDLHIRDCCLIASLTDDGLMALAKIKQLQQLTLINNSIFSRECLTSTLNSTTIPTLTWLNLSVISNLSSRMRKKMKKNLANLKYSRLQIRQKNNIV